MKEIYHHFSSIAPKYKTLRTTDVQPILLIKEKLQGLTDIDAADVGCGVGRYVIKLFEHLGNRLCLACIDVNKNMLSKLRHNLKEHKIQNFTAIRAPAHSLPLSAGAFDCVFSFNAAHHFKVIEFFKEVSRVLRDRGYLFLYTRLRSQNKENIWGKYFPKFYEKENRLHELDELKEAIRGVPGLILESVEYFKYRRAAKLESLIAQAANHHYSTFYLYDEKEFEECLKEFEQNIAREFVNPDRITWIAENIMLVVRMAGRAAIDRRGAGENAYVT